MREFDERLTELHEKMRRLNQLESQLKSLYEQQEKMEAELLRLRNIMNAEQEDVDKLEGLSLSAIFSKLSGSHDEKLAREQKEAFAAAANYQSASRQFDVLKEEIASVIRERNSLRGCEKEYQQALDEKAEAIRTSGDEGAAALLSLEEEIAGLKAQRKETGEAVSAGNRAMHTIESVEDSLSSAHDWGTFDLLGGGLFSTMAKHEHLDEAQSKIGQLQRDLSAFQTEMADVRMYEDLQVKPTGFMTFGDFFFDGLIFDWAVLDQIKQSEQQIADIKEQVYHALDKLEEIGQSLDRRLKELEEKRKQEIERHEMKAE